MPEPALAVIEFSSIAIGSRAGDAIVKRAGIATFRAGTIHPGRFLIVISGGVGEVDESFHEGIRIGGHCVLDQVFLPDAHATVQSAVAGRRSAPSAETLGIIESETVAAVVHAADRAVKSANITIREVRLADGLGGKGILHLDGELSDVQAAIAAGLEVVAARGIEHHGVVIPAVHAMLMREMSESTRFNR